MKKIQFIFLVVCTIRCFQVKAQEYTLALKDTSEVRFLNQRKFFIYKVDKSETMYSISKKFKIPQEEITEFNPGLKEGLKPKMKLWIPAYSHLKKKDEANEVKAKEEQPAEIMYNIALFVELNIPGNYTVDPSLVDSNIVADVVDKESIANLEFYEGVRKAIDSLERKKFQVHLLVFDTENDSLKTIELLRKPEVKKMDLMISNGSVTIIRLISEFSKNHRILFASCTLNSAELLSNNSEAIAMFPASLTQCREMGKLAAGKFNSDNCIVMRTPVSKENERGAAFRNGWSATTSDKLKVVFYSDSLFKPLKDSLSHKLNNVIFVPSSNEGFVSALVNQLKEYSEDYRITLIGLPTWQYFETIDPLLLELLDVHIFTSAFIDYGSAPTIAFRKGFYNTYSVEPMETAFEGYDVMLQLGNELLNHGNKIREFISGKVTDGIYSGYRFEKQSEHSFIENHYISVCKYRNFELKKMFE